MKTDLPKVVDLYTDLSIAQKNDQMMVLLNQPPKADWVKKHPFVSNHLYLPIDKVEFLLKKIFKQNYKIEVLKTGMLMNAVEVTVRVHYLDIVSNTWLFHDGVGAQELQTQKGTGTLLMDMSNVNMGAVTMALPIAKSLAIKDACDHLGTVFGANLNRKDTLQINVDENLDDSDEKWEALQNLLFEVHDKMNAEDIESVNDVIKNRTNSRYRKMFENLTKLKS